jgi:8-oxo-dGTP diphosphatase
MCSFVGMNSRLKQGMWKVKKLNLKTIMKKIDVVAAVIVHQQQVLCMQRGGGKYEYLSYKYEFPGGKVEKGEYLEAALHREIREELLLDITIDRLYLTVEHTYPDFAITLHCFLCSCENTHLTLTEHLEARWMSLDLIATLDWAEADIAVVDKMVYDGSE